MKTGDKAKVSPELTGENEWIRKNILWRRKIFFPNLNIS